MEIKVNKYIYFGSLAKKLKSKKGGFDFEGELAKKIARASRKFIKSGKVTPPLAESTIAKKGSSTPLLDTGNLVDSIRATKKGITYASYGNYHRKGTGPYTIVPKKEGGILKFDTGTVNPLSNRMRGSSVITKKVNHPGLPKREFIVWYADEGEKNKIISNIKRDLSKLLKENLRKK